MKPNFGETQSGEAARGLGSIWLFVISERLSASALRRAHMRWMLGFEELQAQLFAADVERTKAAADADAVSYRPPAPSKRRPVPILDHYVAPWLPPEVPQWEDALEDEWGSVCLAVA